MIDDLVLVPEGVLEALLGSGAPWGWFGLKSDFGEGAHLVVAYSARNGSRHPTVTHAQYRDHHLQNLGEGGIQGWWYRVDRDVLDLWRQLWRRRAGVATDFIVQEVQGWQPLSRGAVTLILTVAEHDGRPDVEAWTAHDQGVQPALAAVVPDDVDPTSLLRPGWPLDSVTSALFTVVGVGSIGSAAAEALAAYAVHRLALVDDDRLLPHNLVRHRARRRWLGLPKVRAMEEVLHERFPYVEVERLPVSVVDAADAMRPLFAESAIVVCCADGIEARVVASHLARTAGTPVVLACVLDDGAFGEVLRLRAGVRTGCLQCQRAAMRDAGQLDPEPGLELAYGTGHRHRPMTAVGGDLGLVGALAAKVAVATVLEAAGFADQRLPSDHAVIGLRYRPDVGAPFDGLRPGEIRWLEVAPPLPGCPTCDP